MSNLHPGLILLAASFIVAFLPQLLRRIVLVIAPVLAGIVYFQLDSGLDLNIMGMGSYELHYLYTDKLSLLFGLIIAGLSLISSVFTYHNGNKKLIMSILAASGSAFGVVFAHDWITFLFSWELMIVASTFMIWSRQTSNARQAGLRYLILHMIAANLLLEATFVNAFEGNTMITPIIDAGTELYWLVLLFLSIGAALFPLHAWVPDSCSESTLTGSIVLSAYVPMCAVYSMIRVFSGQDILIYLGIVTAIYSALRALISDDIRRILSYSLSAQLGIAAVFVGAGSEQAVNAAAALAFAGVFGNAILFMSGMIVIRSLGGEQKLSQMGNMVKHQPVAAVGFLLGGLTVTGVPLLGGFTGFSLGSNAVAEVCGTWAAVCLSIAQAGIFLAIVLRAFWFIFYTENRGAKVSDIVPGNVYPPLITAGIVCILLGVYPGIITDLYPYPAANYTIFNASSILSVLQAVTASCIVFKFLYNILKPQRGLLLDIDWIYRYIADVVITNGSHLLCAVSSALGSGWKQLYVKFMELTSNPMEFLDARPFREKRKYDPENYRTSIADPIMITLTVLVFAVGYFVSSL